MGDTWFAVIDADGNAVSFGTVVADSLPDGLTAIELPADQAAMMAAGPWAWDSAIRSVVALPQPVPESVEARQLRAWLIVNGHDPDAITAAIDAVIDPVQRALTRNEWEYATSYTRRHPMFEAFVRVTGLSAEQIDQAFREAATL